MAHVQFDLTFDFDASPERVWDELVDWKGHEGWIPATVVDIHTDGDPTAPNAEFTAWSGLGRSKLSLQDRMRVEYCDYDAAAQSGNCRVSKLGPMITGWAEFTVNATPGGGTSMEWVEDVKVPYAPQFLAPLLGRVGKEGFRFGMKRLAKLLAAQPVPNPA